MSFLRRSWLSFVPLLLVACHGNGGQEGTNENTDPCTNEPVGAFSLLDFPGEEFWALPLPHDLRLNPDGSLNLTGFPNPGQSADLAEYLTTMAPVTKGFGRNPVIYFPFAEALDPASLPNAPADTEASDAAIFLLDVDPDSPEQGRRFPLHVHYQERASDFLPAHVLILQLPFGIPLRDGTTYAAVVTTRVQDRIGKAVTPHPNLVRALAAEAMQCGTPHEADFRQVYAPLREAGLDPEEVAAATVFTTQTVIEPVRQLREATWAADLGAPQLEQTDSTTTYDYFEGSTPIPNFQRGASPYAETGSGEIVVDGSGVPQVQRIEEVRTSVIVPRGTPPAAGWPILVFAHGTNGDYQSVVNGGIAARLAAMGIASMGFDQVLHGPRNPSDTSPEMAFFNVSNLVAARDNVRQGAVDLFAAIRHIIEGDLGQAVERSFDPTRILFMGHSQGGLTGSPFLAVEPSVQGGVLSGTSGSFTITLLERTVEFMGVEVAMDGLVERMLGLDAGSLSSIHPVANLLQTFMEPADPINYAPYLIRQPAGHPKHIFHVTGFDDTMAPAHGAEAFAAAAGIPLLEPVQREVEAMDLLGIAPVTAPVHRNLTGPNGETATGALYQDPDNGHFLFWDNVEAQEQAYGFLESLAAGDPTIPAAAGTP